MFCIIYVTLVVINHPPRRMSQRRLLAAIMFTDIEGYTALMQVDEKEAVLVRTFHKDAVERLVQKFNGTVVQLYGDGSLSIFNSAVEAVECAIELQGSFLQEEQKIPVRIGLHMGDVIYSDKEVIGDAVNIASRIESCAIPGSVLVSDKIHDQIRSHQHLKATFLDAYELKNVADAMPIYAVANTPLVIPDKQEIKGKFKLLNQENEKRKGKRKYLLWITGILIVSSILLSLNHFLNKKTRPDDYSIAVLPFDNLSTDEDSDIFRDGITEDILTQLSKLKELHVISKTSIMKYIDSKKNVPEIAKELGVSYILEGSVRKNGDKIRITAQLIDAVNDEHIWAENYDKTLTDIFAVQSEVSQEIVEALELNISFDEQQSLKQIPTKNIDAYELFLKARKEADTRTRESLAKSIEMYKDAISMDSLYADAYAEIANTLYLETYYSGRNPEEAAKLSLQYLEKAETINPDLSRIYSVKGLIYNIQDDIENAQEAFEKAIKLSPNDVTARNQYATFFYYNREYDKQLEQAKIAYKLDPLSFVVVNGYFLALTMNYKYDEAEKLMKNYEKYSDESSAFVINRSYFRLYIDQKAYEKAIDPLEKIVGREPAFNRFLAYCYGQIGDTLNAERVIDTIKTSTRIIEMERSHQLAVAYSGIKKTDSVLFYSDFKRNKNTRVFKREYKDFFTYLLKDQRFLEILKEHGINPAE